MDIENMLRERSNNQCELCNGSDNLSVYEVAGSDRAPAETAVLVCNTCLAQIEKREEMNPDHWSVLTKTMWSEVPAVTVLVWRMLNRLKSWGWAADNLEMLYLDEDLQEWAEASNDHLHTEESQLHKDSNGAVLENGDSVVLTRTLDVKGSSIQAKMGTVVKNIRLVEDNPEQIEGRIEGQTIVILTKYLRKQGK